MLNQAEQAAYVARVVDDAEHTFGANRDPALLEAVVRETVLDLWLTRGHLTVAAAEHLLRQMHTEIARRQARPVNAMHNR